MVTKSMESIDELGVPWTAVWLLCRHGTKHIHIRGQLPQTQHWNSKVNSFVNKMRWRWCCRQLPNDNRRLYKREHTPACNEVIDSGLDFWLQRLRTALQRGFQKSRSVAAHTRQAWNNTRKIEKVAMQKLTNMTMVPIPTDKSKKWTLVPRCDLAAIHGNTFQSSEYKDEQLVPSKCRELFVLHRRLVVEIGKEEGEPVV